jgi:hypothetical protein
MNRLQVQLGLMVITAAAVALAPAEGSAQRPILFPSNECKDPWVAKAAKEIVGRSPRGEGNAGGECNVNRYGGGKWGDYDDFKAKFRAGFFGNSSEKRIKAERCFGGVGPKCEGTMGLGRTTNRDGTVNLYVSVGSIMHDNCCLAFPEGKMCHGNNDDLSGKCIKEWDKAVWNSFDGRAWSQTFDPNGEPDLTIVKNPRTTRFRLGGTNMSAGSAMFETAATRQLKAPRGQALDVGDEAFCASGRADTKSFFGKTWIECR